MQTISPEAEKVRQILTEHGLETPMLSQKKSKEQRRTEIQHKMQEVLALIGLDLEDDSLHETPARLAKMYIDEIFRGLDYQHFPKITKIKNTMQLTEPVQVNNITLLSTCEHHFMTIDGTVAVAYYPNKWILGLSKLNRIVDFFAKRPQVQERFTKQLLLALQTILETQDVAIYVNAVHYCVKGRGIQDSNSHTVTSAYGGVFLNDRKERRIFLECIK